jgi:hypothetical protein
MDCLENMFLRLRCRIALWLLRQKFEWKYWAANLVCPSTTELAQGSRKARVPIPLPKVSHVFYHQASVEVECAENALRSLLWNIAPSDEVILYDKGGTLPPACFEMLAGQQWRSWAVHREVSPDMASYTYGMNHSIPMTQAPIVMMWRSDYIYPRGLYQAYLDRLPGHEIVLPYEVIIGAEQVRADFVRAHWDKFEPYDGEFWRANAAEIYSIYESQDPVHFAIRRRTWDRLGGLDHRLWGYGWQFGEFAARLRYKLPRRKIRYFDFDPPVHQNHASSLMVRSSNYTAEKAERDRIGRDRFADFLGGQAMFDCYFYMWQKKLKPIPKEQRT